MLMTLGLERSRNVTQVGAAGPGDCLEYESWSGQERCPVNPASCFTGNRAHKEQLPSLPPFFFFFSFGCATWLVGFQFLDQGLNPGHGSESPESYSLGHQGTPSPSILNLTARAPSFTACARFLALRVIGSSIFSLSTSSDFSYTYSNLCQPQHKT